MAEAGLDLAHDLLDVVQGTSAARAADKVRLAAAAVGGLQDVEREQDAFLRALVAVDNDGIAKTVRHEASDVGGDAERLGFVVCNFRIKENRVLATCSGERCSKGAHAGNHLRAGVAEHGTCGNGGRILGEARDIHRVLEFHDRLLVQAREREFRVAAFAGERNRVGLHADLHRAVAANLHAGDLHGLGSAAFVMVRVLLEDRHVVSSRSSGKRTGLDEFLRHRDFGHRVFGERDADRIGKAIEQKRTDTRSRLETPVGTGSGLGHAHMERVRLEAFLLDAGGEHAVSGNRHAGIAALQT